MYLGSTAFTLILSLFVCVGDLLRRCLPDADFRFFALCDKCGGISCRMCEDVDAPQLTDETKMENSPFYFRSLHICRNVEYAIREVNEMSAVS